MRAIGLLVIPRSSGSGSGGGALALASISPNLGDIYAGAIITFTGTGLGSATAATLGGLACTSVVAVNSTTVTAKAPALAAGAAYSAQVSAASGASNALTNAYEAWHPTVDYPAARVFQSDRGVTSTGSTSRARVGTINDPMFAGYIVRDGATLVQLASTGRVLLIGGWNPGVWGASPAGDVTNEILFSDDRGLTWATLLARDPAPPTLGAGARFLPGHSAAVFKHVSGSVEYVYWIGVDANGASTAGVRDGSVWRSSDGCATWTRISTAAPTADKSLYHFASYGGAIYIFGGQQTLNTPATAVSEVWKSTDDGVTWTRLTDGPWAGRCGPSSPSLVYGGFLWLIGGAKYATLQASRTYYNDVWKFDGTTWTQVLADGHAQWTGRHYHGLVIHHSKMWIIAGFALASASLGETDAIYSSDGATWTKIAADNTTVMPWQGMHAQATLTLSDDSQILITHGVSDTGLQRLYEHTGPLASAWVDQGSGALSLSQATAGSKFLVDPTALGGNPGLLASAGFMALASPDRGIAGGVMETWVVGKTLDRDATNDASDPASTLVGAANASAYNQALGLTAGRLRTYDGSISWRFNEGTSVYYDDVVRLMGSEHQNASLKLFRGTTQDGTTKTDVSFSTTWTGWDSLGQGFTGLDLAKSFVYGAVVIIPTSAASSATFRTKLNKWVKKWGSTT